MTIQINFLKVIKTWIFICLWRKLGEFIAFYYTAKIHVSHISKRLCIEKGQGRLN